MSKLAPFCSLSKTFIDLQDIRPSKKTAGVKVELYAEVPRCAYQGKLKSFVNPCCSSK